MKTQIKNALIIAIAIVVFISCMFLLRQYVFTIVRVDGPAMSPTLVNEDRVLIDKISKNYKNGDIIVFRVSNGNLFIKRIIASAGQIVDIDFSTSSVYVDGELIEEPYIKEQIWGLRGDILFPITVTDDSYFVLGDNRNNSLDSRRSEIGMVHESQVIGKKFGGFIMPTWK